MDGGNVMKGGMGGRERERGERWTRMSEVDEGRAGGGAEGCRDDSTACTTAAAVIGSHHSSAILTMSPPIYPDRLCACHFPSGEGERATEREAMRTGREADREQLGLVRAK